MAPGRARGDTGSGAAQHEQRRIRHWGTEIPVLLQPDLDQRPKFKRHLPGEGPMRRGTITHRRPFSSSRHHHRKGMAWWISGTDGALRHKGGIAWEIPLDENTEQQEEGASKQSTTANSEESASTAAHQKDGDKGARRKSGWKRSLRKVLKVFHLTSKSKARPAPAVLPPTLVRQRRPIRVTRERRPFREDLQSFTRPMEQGVPVAPSLEKKVSHVAEPELEDSTMAAVVTTADAQKIHVAAHEQHTHAATPGTRVTVKDDLTGKQRHIKSSSFSAAGMPLFRQCEPVTRPPSTDGHQTSATRATQDSATKDPSGPMHKQLHSIDNGRDAHNTAGVRG